MRYRNQPIHMRFFPLTGTSGCIIGEVKHRHIMTDTLCDDRYLKPWFHALGKCPVVICHWHILALPPTAVFGTGAVDFQIDAHELQKRIPTVLTLAFFFPTITDKFGLHTVMLQE